MCNTVQKIKVMSKMLQMHALCKIFLLYWRLLKTSKILKQAILDYIEFILFHVKDVRVVYMCMNYNVDCNLKYSN